ncbi:MAG: 2-hydroxyacyl-CoA dehydratase family protein [Bacillota bacterium]
MAEELKQNLKTVGWFCTYTPEEIIYAAGLIPYRLLPHKEVGHASVEDALPPNICPYPRKILSNLRSGLYDDLQGIVVANSCNAMTHLYNVLKEESDFFVYLLDVPRRQDQKACEYFAGELELLADFLGEKGNPVNNYSLLQALKLYGEKKELIEKALALNGEPRLKEAFPLGLYSLAVEATSLPPEEFAGKYKDIIEDESTNSKADNNVKKNNPGKNGAGPNSREALMLAGGLPPRGLIEMLTGYPGLNLYPENCAGMRYLQKPMPEIAPGKEQSRTEIMEKIARSYLEKPPCPRVFNRNAREKYCRDLLEELQVDAVIYHDLMFCDMGHYDYLMLQDLLKEKDIPHLKVKSELGEEDLGQLKTRVEAFLEILE